MGTDNMNNRITDRNSPEVLALINTNIRLAVQEIAEQFDAAVREHGPEIAEAYQKYFGKLE